MEEDREDGQLVDRLVAVELAQEVVHIEPVEEGVGQAKEDGRQALLPVGGEAAAEVAHPVVVEGPLVGEQEEAVFLWDHLDLLMGGLEVEAGPDEGADRGSAIWASLTSEASGRATRSGRVHLLLT